MKLLFVTCLSDFKADIMKIFHEAKVKVFSVTETTGVKDEHVADLLDDWFGSCSVSPPKLPRPMP